MDHSFSLYVSTDEPFTVAGAPPWPPYEPGDTGDPNANPPIDPTPDYPPNNYNRIVSATFEPEKELDVHGQWTGKYIDVLFPGMQVYHTPVEDLVHYPDQQNYPENELFPLFNVVLSGNIDDDTLFPKRIDYVDRSLSIVTVGGFRHVPFNEHTITGFWPPSPASKRSRYKIELLYPYRDNSPVYLYVFVEYDWKKAQKLLIQNVRAGNF